MGQVPSQPNVSDWPWRESGKAGMDATLSPESTIRAMVSFSLLTGMNLPRVRKFRTKQHFARTDLNFDKEVVVRDLAVSIFH